MEQKSKKRTSPPRYDDTFRAGAVRLVVEQHCPAKEVAAKLGICMDTLKSWLKAAGVHPGSAERENRDLRRLRELEAEVKNLAQAGRREKRGDRCIKKIRRHPLQTIEDKYRYILADSSGVSVDKLCRMLEISRSGYYAWQHRGASPTCFKQSADVKRAGAYA